MYSSARVHSRSCLPFAAQSDTYECTVDVVLVSFCFIMHNIQKQKQYHTDAFFSLHECCTFGQYNIIVCPGSFLVHSLNDFLTCSNNENRIPHFLVTVHSVVFGGDTLDPCIVFLRLACGAQYVPLKKHLHSHLNAKHWNIFRVGCFRRLMA